MVQIYNSLTRRKEEFQPLDAGNVRMYVCGITVYDYCHLGHARMLTVFDVVSRYLREAGYPLTYVRNITDIDDNIIERAARNGETVDVLTERFIAAMNEDCAALGILTPDHEPRATRYVDEILAMIGRLIERGLAYQADNGDVYYHVSAFPQYGALSGSAPDDLRAGARVEVDTAKKDPLDFVLWKSAKPGEPAWDSPWGSGRPGWHIECSAMSTALLGEHFDIHGGGMDLKFPHHENEIAQSCGANGGPFANVWMHNGFVQVDDEKMAKSVGNFFTIRDVMERYHADEIRYFFLTTHYRSPLNYSDAELTAARAALTRLYTALRGHSAAEPPAVEEYTARLHAAMSDDFNTPEALAVLFELARDCNRARDEGKTRLAAKLAALLARLGKVLGLLEEEPEVWLRRPQHGGAGLSNEEVDALVLAREAAREQKDFSEADRLRGELSAAGIVLEDGSKGTKWRRGTGAGDQNPTGKPKAN